MSDLIDKYFQEDLSDAEDEALSRRLRTSDEAAEKFVEASRRAYLDCGLPEPDWEGPVPPFKPPPPGGLGWGWALSLAVAALLAGGAFLLRDRIPDSWKSVFTGYPAPGVNDARGNSAGKASSKIGDPRPMKAGAPLKGPDTGAQERPAPDDAGSKVPPAGVETSPLGQPSGVPTGREYPSRHPAATPIDLDRGPSQGYPGLSVSVRLLKPESVTVRVLDGQGVQVGLLYQGGLQPGNWEFKWDGKLSNGLPAQPGYYRIETQVGNYSQRKTVQIR